MSENYRIRFGVLILAIALLAGCGQKPGAETAKSPAASVSSAATAASTSPGPSGLAIAKLTIATGTKGGVYWPMGQEMANIWNGEVPDVQVEAISTGGTAENILKMGLREANLALAVNGIIYYAVSGTGEYKAMGKQPFLRGVMGLHPNVLHFVAMPQAGVNSLKDIDGKRWVPGEKGSATEVNTREVLSALNVDAWTRTKSYYMGYDEAAARMKEGKMDGATIAAGVGAKAAKDVLAAGAKIISLKPDELTAVQKMYPFYFPYTIPAGSYEGQKEPIQTLAQANILVAREDVPVDMVYRMVKSIYEKHPQLMSKVAAAKEIVRSNGLNGITDVVPVHLGAEKYFREVGVIPGQKAA